jgi:glucosamine-phosphate N-acetyltransferase
VASGRVVGAITFLLEPKLIHGGGIVGHIEDVAVHSDFMNRGVGRQLIGHAISFCRKNSAYKVILNCNSELEAYYLQLGFHNHGAEMRLNLNE